MKFYTFSINHARFLAGYLMGHGLNVMTGHTIHGKALYINERNTVGFIETTTTTHQMDTEERDSISFATYQELKRII